MLVRTWELQREGEVWALRRAGDSASMWARQGLHGCGQNLEPGSCPLQGPLILMIWGAALRYWRDFCLHSCKPLWANAQVYDLIHSSPFNRSVGCLGRCTLCRDAHCCSALFALGQPLLHVEKPLDSPHQILDLPS